MKMIEVTLAILAHFFQSLSGRFFPGFAEISLILGVNIIVDVKKQDVAKGEQKLAVAPPLNKGSGGFPRRTWH